MSDNETTPQQPARTLTRHTLLKTGAALAEMSWQNVLDSVTAGTFRAGTAAAQELSRQVLDSAFGQPGLPTERGKGPPYRDIFPRARTESTPPSCRYPPVQSPNAS